VAALTAAVASGPIPVSFSSADLPRCPPDVEAAVYFTCLEAVQNATKHSRATKITIDIRLRHVAGASRIELAVADNGTGFDVTRRTGNGLFNITDRIECVLGSASIESTPGQGTTVRAAIPLADSRSNGPSRSNNPAQQDQPATARDVVPIAGS
jgi:signal transduction histidine kinase